MKLPNKVFITGTDTSVGKTVVTASLSYCLCNKLDKVSVVKPVQTGTSSQRILDIEFIYKVLNKEFIFSDHCYYRFADPLSPKAASDLSKTKIDVQSLKAKIITQIKSNDIVLIEGAGGLLVPLNADFLMVHKHTHIHTYTNTHKHISHTYTYTYTYPHTLPHTLNHL